MREKPQSQWPSMAESAVMILDGLRAGSPVATNTVAARLLPDVATQDLRDPQSESPAYITPGCLNWRVGDLRFLSTVGDGW
jgi:hypothetical protein